VICGHRVRAVSRCCRLDKFSYDVWGDTVNTASRMESHGVPGHIQVTDRTYRRLRDGYRFQKRGPIHVKGMGELVTYLLLGRGLPSADELHIERFRNRFTL
jgi:adenylate cyclase